MSDNWIPMDGDAFDDDALDADGIAVEDSDAESDEADERALEFALAAARAEFG
ncbi:MAG: hypothetical protein F2836_02635, partial [Actinobacteria bacterium]|nr:hypothetical protein [Actinomycetota bacterium]